MIFKSVILKNKKFQIFKKFKILSKNAIKHILKIL